MLHSSYATILHAVIVVVVVVEGGGGTRGRGGGFSGPREVDPGGVVRCSTKPIRLTAVAVFAVKTIIIMLKSIII